MNRRVLICSMGLLLVCLLAVSAIGEKPSDDEKQISKIERKNESAQTTQTTKPETSTTSAVAPVQNLIADDANPQVLAPVENLVGQDADAYAVPWKSINGGGGTATTTTHRVSVSIGQTLIGYTASDDHAAGIGFWYGFPAAGECFCGSPWGDLNDDGKVDPIDVVYMINYVYKNLDGRITYPTCPAKAGNANCDAVVDPVDVVYYINYVYRNLNGFCADPCTS